MFQRIWIYIEEKQQNINLTCQIELNNKLKCFNIDFSNKVGLFSVYIPYVFSYSLLFF